MKKLRVEEAVGLKLCHDLTKVIPGEFKGIAFKRDHIIKAEDVEELLSIGKEHVFVWEENAGEIHEDEAAIRIAQAVGMAASPQAEPVKTPFRKALGGIS